MTTINALVIEPTNDDYTVMYLPLQDDTLAHLQQLVGGWVETVVTDDPDLTFWVNEEGALPPGLPVNALATQMWRARCSDARLANNFASVSSVILRGVTVITGGVGPDGETLSLPEDWQQKWSDIINWEESD